MKPDYNANHVMLTPKIKSSESAVALKRISQLRRSGIANSTPCKCDQQKHTKKSTTYMLSILRKLSAH